MRNEDRAKQFMPFAALKGYEELIEEQSEQPTKPPQLLKSTEKPPKRKKRLDIEK